MFVICITTVQSQEATRRYRDLDNTMMLRLPKSWNFRCADSGPITEIKITPTFLMSDDAIFNTGVSVRRSKNAVTSFQRGGVLLVEQQKESRYEIAKSDSLFTEHATGQYSAGDYKGVITEISYRRDYESPLLRMFVIWLVNDTDLIEINMISLSDEWSKMRPVFMEALSSLNIRQ